MFGLDNRPGETDAEASRNQLPLPDVPAFVVSPLGRGELMGYDGLGGDDVMRVLADVRRAYPIDPERITLTGLSMGGGGTWAIGLRHPELFAALAPVCAIADFRRMVRPPDAALYDLARLDALSPPAIAENAAHQQVFIFHGDKDPTVSGRGLAQDGARATRRSAGWARTSTTPSIRASDMPAWIPAYKDAELLRTLAAIKRDPAAPKTPLSPPPPGEAIPGLRRQERPPPAPAPLRLRHERSARGGGGRARAGDRARRLGADDRGEVRGQERPRGDAPTIARGSTWCWSARRRSTRSPGELAVPMPDARPLGDRAFRAVVPDPRAPEPVRAGLRRPDAARDSRGCSASPATTGTPGRPRATARSRCSTTEPLDRPAASL